jgi:hypothetical protein
MTRRLPEPGSAAELVSLHGIEALCDLPLRENGVGAVFYVSRSLITNIAAEYAVEGRDTREAWREPLYGGLTPNAELVQWIYPNISVPVPTPELTLNVKGMKMSDIHAIRILADLLKIKNELVKRYNQPDGGDVPDNVANGVYRVDRMKKDIESLANNLVLALNGNGVAIIDKTMISLRAALMDLYLSSNEVNPPKDSGSGGTYYARSLRFHGASCMRLGRIFSTR